MKLSLPHYWRRLLSSHQAARRRRSRSQAPQCESIEVLEDRRLLTVAISPAYGKETLMTKAPYTVMSSPAVHVIFWGPDWSNGKGTPTANQVDDRPFQKEIKSILASTYLSGLTEYGGNGKVGTPDFTLDNDRVPSDFYIGNDDPGFAELSSLVQHKKVADPGNPSSLLQAPIYAFVTDPNDQPSDAGGFNDWGHIDTKSGSQLVNFIQVSATSSSISGFGPTLAHEMVEKMTDPGAKVNDATSTPL